MLAEDWQKRQLLFISNSAELWVEFQLKSDMNLSRNSAEI
jgi:hypothetical protein